MKGTNNLRIAVFGNLHRTDLKEQLQILLHFFDGKDVTVLLEEYMEAYIEEQFGRSFEQCELIVSDNFHADLALSVGGDGTFLNTALHVGRKEIPILGINSGRLGFLADVGRNEIIAAMTDVFDRRYEIEKRTVLQVKAMDGNILDSPFALNDVAISKQDSSSMIIVNAHTNNELINSYQADGLIIATPTGSTAYSMSVGGPIVVPRANSFVISPVASHSLNVRPLIVPDDWVIDLEVQSRSNSYLIAIDGRSKTLDHSTRLQIRKADYTVQVLKTLDHTFFETLRKKLMWGVDPRK